ncbi:tail fiber domain-containing protein, partial [bacterium]|nr:tail fiber domain-containing protein [bacterium]
PGSTLNADVLDGVDSTGFAAVGHTHAGDFWALGGNGGTSPGIDFVGTTDNQAVELRVNGARALRVEPGSTPSLIGGYAANTADAGVVGASIGGGGETGSPNRVTDDFGTVGGGGDNRAGNNDGTTDDATYATVGGGQGNTAGYVCATVGGGFENTAQVEYSFVGGGIQNLADSHCSTVGGGARNSAGRDYATVGGGQDNIAGVFLSGENATVPGGRLCFAVGDYSFAAGRRAKADHKGAFVWGDSQDADIHSTQDDQVTFRCLGGVRFTSGSSGANQEVSWAPGDSSWTFSSDRDLKENFVEIDPKEVLDRISRVSITEWNFKGYSQRHIGPMAQDFHALFALGGSDTMIDSGDLQGVSLAAIQGLHEIVKEKDAKISSLESRIEALETFVKKLAESQAGGEE